MLEETCNLLYNECIIVLAKESMSEVNGKLHTIVRVDTTSKEILRGAAKHPILFRYRPKR